MKNRKKQKTGTEENDSQKGRNINNNEKERKKCGERKRKNRYNLK